jgi:hypothetical protein
MIRILPFSTFRFFGGDRSYLCLFDRGALRKRSRQASADSAVGEGLYDDVERPFAARADRPWRASDEDYLDLETVDQSARQCSTAWSVRKTKVDKCGIRTRSMGKSLFQRRNEPNDLMPLLQHDPFKVRGNDRLIFDDKNAHYFLPDFTPPVPSFPVTASVTMDLPKRGSSL